MNKSSFTLIGSALACVVSGLLVSSQAQTDAQRKQRFDAILPSGSWIRMVWQRESASTGNPDNYGSSVNSLKLFDSRTGEVKTIKAQTAGSRWVDVSFSPDGTKILYFDRLKKNIHVMNADGTGDAILISALRGYYEMGRTWRSPEGKQYLLLTKKPTTTQVIVYRVNINDINDTVRIVSRDQSTCIVTLKGNLEEAWGQPVDHYAVQWCTLTPDGRYLLGGFPGFGRLGIIDLQTSMNVARFTVNGCWPSVCVNGGNRILFQDQPGNHRMVRSMAISPIANCMMPGQDSVIYDIRPIIAATQSEQEECLRFTNHPDYATLSLKIKETADDYRGLPNPILVKLTDLTKYAAVHDAVTSGEGNTDTYFYSAVPAAPGRLAAAVRPHGAHRSSLWYDFQGRMIDQEGSRKRGVFVHSSGVNSGSRCLVVR